MAIGTDQPLELDEVLSGPSAQREAQSAEEAEIYVLADLTARAAVADIAAVCRGFVPALIIRDSAEFGGYLVGEGLGIPHITVDTCLATSLYYRRTLFCSTINRLRSLRGMSVDRDCKSLFRYLHVTCSPPEFWEGSGELPPTAVFCRQENVVGPTDELPFDLNDLPDRPTILVSLGTLARGPRLLMHIYRALRGEDVTLIFKYAHADEAVFARLNDERVLAGANVSPTAVLPSCNLFITHAGYNGVKEAIRVGVPMVMLPQFGDQPYIAERCQRLGIGRILDQGGARDVTRQVVLGALGDSSLASSMWELRDRMLEQPSLDEVAQVVENLP